MPEGQMYVLSFELRPSAANSELDGIGGAFVICWIKRPSPEAAAQAAREHLAESGWTILSQGDTKTVDLKNVPGDSEKYYRQAEVDGEVFLIHSFPPEPADA